jgi:hypothetical protein
MFFSTAWSPIHALQSVGVARASLRISNRIINICVCNHLEHTSELITFNREAIAVIKMLQEHCWLDLVSKSDPTMPSTTYRNSRICPSHNLLQIGRRRNPLKSNKSLLLWSQAEYCLSWGTGNLDQAYSVFRDACEGPWARFSRLHMRALVCHNINASQPCVDEEDGSTHHLHNSRPSADRLYWST